MCSGKRCTLEFLVQAGRSTARLNSWASIVFKKHQWSTSARDFLTQFFPHDTNLFYREKQDEIVLLKKVFSKTFRSGYLSVNLLWISMKLKQEIFLKNEGGGEIPSSDSTIDQSTCVKRLGNKIGKLFFDFHFADVVKNLPMQFSVISRITHSIKKTRLLDYYRTYNKPVIGYGLLLHGCNSGNRVNPRFVLHKKIQRQTCLKFVIIRLQNYSLTYMW